MIDLIFSATPATEYQDFWTGEIWREELADARKHADLSELNAGAPLQDAHNQFSCVGILGRVERAWCTADGKLMARVRGSVRPEASGIMKDVVAGVITKVSMAYHGRAYKVSRVRRGSYGVRVRRCVDWLPVEISLVPRGADTLARITGFSQSPGVVPADLDAGRMRAGDHPDPAALYDHLSQTPEAVELRLGINALRRLWDAVNVSPKRLFAGVGPISPGLSREAKVLIGRVCGLQEVIQKIGAEFIAAGICADGAVDRSALYRLVPLLDEWMVAQFHTHESVRDLIAALGQGEVSVDNSPSLSVPVGGER